MQSGNFFSVATICMSAETKDANAEASLALVCEQFKCIFGTRSSDPLMFHCSLEDVCFFLHFLVIRSTKRYVILSSTMKEL